MLVRELMRREVVTTTADASLPQIVSLLIENEVDAIPVVDHQMHVVGIVTATDFLTMCLPQKIQFLDMNIYLEGARVRDEVLENAGDVLVGEIMSHPVICAIESTPLGKVVGLMLDHQINQIPVVEDYRLVGMVSRIDILRYLGRKMNSGRVETGRR